MTDPNYQPSAPNPNYHPSGQNPNYHPSGQNPNYYQPQTAPNYYQPQTTSNYYPSAPNPNYQQPIPNNTTKKEDKLLWWHKALIVVGICFVIYLLISIYAYTINFSSNVIGPSFGPKPAKSTGTGTGTKPLVIKFITQPGNYWDVGKAGQYKCPTATGVDVLGDNKNFANYCIFTGTNAKTNAEKYCTSDPDCLGYITDGKGKYQLTSRGVVEDTSKPSNNFNLKHIGTNKYILDSTKQWDSGKAGDYTCPNATGVDTHGTWSDYCIFTGSQAPLNAMKQCEADSKCVGYFVGSYNGNSQYQLTSKGGAPMTSSTTSPPNNYFAIDFTSEYGV